MGLADDAADEVAVDLEVVEGQALEVVEGAESRAEVVQREPAAAGAQPVGEGLGLLDVGDRRRLRQLEDQTRGIDAGVRQRALDERGDPGIADRLAREVDVEHEPAARARVLGDQLDRLARDPAVDLLDQAEALGDVEERARRERLAALLGPEPQQQLVLADLVLPQVEDRLAVEEQAILFERRADRSASASRADTCSRRPRPGSYSATRFRPACLASYIARSAKASTSAAREAVEQGDPDAGRDMDRLVAEHRDLPAQGLDDPVGHDLRLVGVRLGKEHGELVSAHPRQDVRLAHAMPQRPGDALEEIVARLVAEGVVDVLEIVQIDHEHRALGAVARHPLGLPGQLLLEAAPVEETGQEIVIDQVLEAFRQLLPLRDVLNLGDDIERPCPDRRGRATRSAAPRGNGPRRGGSASRPGSWESGRRGAPAGSPRRDRRRRDASWPEASSPSARPGCAR